MTDKIIVEENNTDEELEEIKYEIEEHLEDIQEDIDEKLEDIEDEIKEDIEDVKEEVKETLDEIKEEIPTWLEKVLNPIAEMQTYLASMQEMTLSRLATLEEKMSSIQQVSPEPETDTETNTNETTPEISSTEQVESPVENAEGDPAQIISVEVEAPIKALREIIKL